MGVVHQGTLGCDRRHGLLHRRGRTRLGLIRYHVLFAIDIASRNVEILGIAVNPGGPWMEQMARNLVDAVDGFLLGKRYYREAA